MKKNINLSRIMSRAWTMAREGADRFGGNVKMYFAIALSMAWQEEKVLAIAAEPKPVTVYHKGLGNIFLLPGVPMPVYRSQNGRPLLPGISE